MSKEKENIELGKNKAKELVAMFLKPCSHNVANDGWSKMVAKKCAILAVENEYKSLREMLFNLKSCRVIESEKVYLSRLQGLIDEEQDVIEAIKNN